MTEEDLNQLNHDLAWLTDTQANCANIAKNLLRRKISLKKTRRKDNYWQRTRSERLKIIAKAKDALSYHMQRIAGDINLLEIEEELEHISMCCTTCPQVNVDAIKGRTEVFKCSIDPLSLSGTEYFIDRQGNLKRERQK